MLGAQGAAVVLKSHRYSRNKPELLLEHFREDRNGLGTTGQHPGWRQ
jgi:hypothetical protein